jgi:hypothetical protein
MLEHDFEHDHHYSEKPGSTGYRLFARRVGASVKMGLHVESLASLCRTDEVDPDFVTGDRPSVPVHGHVAPQPIFDLVPHRRIARGIVDASGPQRPLVPGQATSPGWEGGKTDPGGGGP